MGEQWINPIGHNEKLSETLIQTLIETAVKQLRFSYTPYSHFKVGAALLAADGTIYLGQNTGADVGDVGRAQTEHLVVHGQEHQRQLSPEKRHLKREH